MTDDFSVPRFFPDRMRAIRRRCPTVFFLDSMSDVSAWEPGWRAAVMDEVRDNPQHAYFMLTKRPDLLEGTSDFADMPWVWLGTSVTRADDLWRLDALRRVDVARRMASFEPLLGPIPTSTDLSGIEWVVMGEETGPEAALHRPQATWAWDVVRLARSVGAKVSVRSPMTGRDGFPCFDEMPEELASIATSGRNLSLPTFDSLLGDASE